MNINKAIISIFIFFFSLWSNISSSQSITVLGIKYLYMTWKFYKNFQYFTSTSNAYRTFSNLYIKISLNINISETKRAIELRYCMLYIFKV